MSRNSTRMQMKVGRKQMDWLGESEDGTKSIVFDGILPDKQEIIFIKRWHVRQFFKIIDNNLDEFFEFDHCFILADNYLIAMVFTYFIRASFSPSEYTPYNFFIGLHLANIMEEDDDVAYGDLQTWALSKSMRPENSNILKDRDAFLKRINYHCIVSRACCDRVMEFVNPGHQVWQRKRHANHSGAISSYYRKYNFCPNCILEHVSGAAEDEKIPENTKTDAIALVDKQKKVVH